MLSAVRQTKYPIDAFLFVQRGLDFTVTRLHGKDAQNKPQGNADACKADAASKAELPSRHVSGQQLCRGLRDFAIEQYGLMAQAVLRRWKITSSEDFGAIVFAMVKAKLMRKTEHDRLEDFNDVFDFSEAFSPQLLLSDKA